MKAEDRRAVQEPYRRTIEEYQRDVEREHPDIAAARRKAQEAQWARNRAKLAELLHRKGTADV